MQKAPVLTEPYLPGRLKRHRGFGITSASGFNLLVSVLIYTFRSLVWRRLLLTTRLI
jgi:hypothetical protein